MTFFFLMNKDKYIEREQKEGLNSSQSFGKKKKTLGGRKEMEMVQSQIQKAG